MKPKLTRKFYLDGPLEAFVHSVFPCHNWKSSSYELKQHDFLFFIFYKTVFWDTYQEIKCLIILDFNTLAKVD